MMGNIAKRPNGQYRARYRNAEGREFSKHFPRRTDAQAWLDSVTSAVSSGTYTNPKAGSAMFADWSKDWLATQSQLKPSTHVRYESLLRRQILPRWGNVALNHITHAEVAGWVSQLTNSGLSASTARQAYRVMSLCLALAVRDGRLARNPADKIPLPRAVKGEPKFLTHTEVDALAQACGEYALVIRVLACTGLRFGELAALRVGRLDLMRRRIEVAASVSELNGKAVFGTPKTHQRRSVPIPRSVVDDLAVLVAGKGPDDLVFTTPSGSLLRLMNFRRRVFDPACNSLGLKITPHDLRHTAASLAVSAGGNVKVVQRMLGHASAAMTLDVYSGLFEDDLDSVADRMDVQRGQVAVSAHVLTMKPQAAG